MKRAILIGATAGLLLGGAVGLVACRQEERVVASSVALQKVAVHKLSDSRFAFQNRNELWYWYVYADGTARTEGGSLNMPGVWTLGARPAPRDLAESSTVDVEIPMTQGGVPLSPSQAAVLYSQTQ